MHASEYFTLDAADEPDEVIDCDVGFVDDAYDEVREWIYPVDEVAGSYLSSIFDDEFDDTERDERAFVDAAVF